MLTSNDHDSVDSSDDGPEQLVGDSVDSSDDGPEQLVGAIHVHKASCGHYVPRPPNWEDAALPARPTLLVVQMLADQVARRTGTPYYERQRIVGLGEVKAPVVLCPDCRDRVRRLLGA